MAQKLFQPKTKMTILLDKALFTCYSQRGRTELCLFLQSPRAIEEGIVVLDKNGEARGLIRPDLLARASFFFKNI